MIRRVMICVLLGVITTIAVAWGCAMWVDARAGMLTGSMYWGHGDTWSYWLFKRQGSLTIQRAVAGPTARAWTSGLPYQEMVPDWSGVRHSPTDEERRFRGTWVEDARGWPALCLRSERKYPAQQPPAMLQFVNANAARTRGIAAVPASVMPRSPLLLRPIWSGMAMNVAAYGAAWFVLLFVPGMIRRAMRTRAGHCPRCGYDLRYSKGEICSECGSVTG